MRRLELSGGRERRTLSGAGALAGVPPSDIHLQPGQQDANPFACSSITRLGSERIYGPSEIAVIVVLMWKCLDPETRAQLHDWQRV